MAPSRGACTTSAAVNSDFHHPTAAKTAAPRYSFADPQPSTVRKRAQETFSGQSGGEATPTSRRTWDSKSLRVTVPGGLGRAKRLADFPDSRRQRRGREGRRPGDPGLTPSAAGDTAAGQTSPDSTRGSPWAAARAPSRRRREAKVPGQPAQGRSRLVPVPVPVGQRRAGGPEGWTRGLARRGAALGRQL